MDEFFAHQEVALLQVVDQKPQTTQYISLCGIEKQSKKNLRSCLLPEIIKYIIHES